MNQHPKKETWVIYETIETNGQKAFKKDYFGFCLFSFCLKKTDKEQHGTHVSLSNGSLLFEEPFFLNMAMILHIKVMTKLLFKWV